MHWEWGNVEMALAPGNNIASPTNCDSVTAAYPPTPSNYRLSVACPVVSTPTLSTGSTAIIEELSHP